MIATDFISGTSPDALWLWARFFGRGVIIGLSIAAPVGPIGLLCIKRSLAQGRVQGSVSGLGAATADAIYAALGGFALSAAAPLLHEATWPSRRRVSFLPGMARLLRSLAYQTGAAIAACRARLIWVSAGVDSGQSADHRFICRGIRRARSAFHAEPHANGLPCRGSVLRLCSVVAHTQLHRGPYASCPQSRRTARDQSGVRSDAHGLWRVCTQHRAWRGLLKGVGYRAEGLLWPTRSIPLVVSCSEDWRLV
jgi:hypothetical protein